MLAGALLQAVCAACAALGIVNVVRGAPGIVAHALVRGLERNRVALHFWGAIITQSLWAALFLGLLAINAVAALRWAGALA